MFKSKSKLKFLFLLSLFFIMISSGLVLGLTGSGTDGDPYQLLNCSDFTEIGSGVGVYYDVMNNINFSECGTHTASSNFAGYLRGNEFTLTNMVISNGLFIQSLGTIKDLYLENVICNGVTYGGVFSQTTGTGTLIFSNVHLLNVNVTVDRNVGGFVGISGSNTQLRVYNSSLENARIIATHGTYGDAGAIASICGGSSASVIISQFKGVNIYYNAVADKAYLCKGTYSNIAGTNIYLQDVNFNQASQGLFSNDADPTCDNCYIVTADEIPLKSISTGITNSFYDADINGVDCSITTLGGICSNTTAMQTLSTFTDEGWDFTNIWDFTSGMYPYFIWEDMFYPMLEITEPEQNDTFIFLNSNLLNVSIEANFNETCDILNNEVTKQTVNIIEGTYNFTSNFFVNGTNNLNVSCENISNSISFNVCIVNYYCSSFDTCIDATQECLTVNDSNVCGVAFNDSLSLYDTSCTPTSGDYISSGIAPVIPLELGTCPTNLPSLFLLIIPLVIGFVLIGMGFAFSVPMLVSGGGIFVFLSGFVFVDCNKFLGIIIITTGLLFFIMGLAIANDKKQ